MKKYPPVINAMKGTNTMKDAMTASECTLGREGLRSIFTPKFLRAQGLSFVYLCLSWAVYVITVLACAAFETLLSTEGKSDQRASPTHVQSASHGGLPARGHYHSMCINTLQHRN